MSAARLCAVRAGMPCVQGLALGMLTAGLALAGAAHRNWQEYARLGVLLPVLLASLSATRHWGGQARAAVFMATAVTAAATQLSLPAHDARSAGLWIALGVVAWSGSLAQRRAGARAAPGLSSGLQLTVVLTCLGILLTSIAAGLVPGMRSRWPASLQWLLFPVLWLGLARALVEAAPRGRCWLAGPLTLVIGGVCVAGAVPLAGTLYELHAGNRAARTGDYATAIQDYRQALRHADRLGLERLQDTARLGLATSLASRGARRQAWQVLGVDPARGVTISPDQWEGPAGGHLFRNASCWRDLWLWQGPVRVAIRAHGRPARGVWPRLKVELDGKPLGVMVVASATGTTQTFSARVTTGRHRLRVSLVEGFWSSRGEQRWVRLDTVFVRYAEASR